MRKENLSEMCSAVMDFFNKTVYEVDKFARFVKRESKLGAQAFVETLVSGCLSDPQISLERMCRLMKGRGINISKQGLHQRFTPEAELLMKGLLSKTIEDFQVKQRQVFDLLKPFSNVKILDSSGVSLPSILKKSFRGSGGSASEAGVKIQVLFDYVNSQLNEVKVMEGRRNDQTFEEHLKTLTKGTLLLQDLGYFKLKSFAKMNAQGVYFVSRHFSSRKLVDQAGEELDLPSKLEKLKKKDSVFTQQVCLGGKKGLALRLIAFRLSNEQVEKRIRSIKVKHQKSGKTPSQRTLALAKWSIYVTNVSEDILTNEQVHLVYTLRWQIELLFKVCKSEAGIDKVSGRTSSRVLCELYAKLICVVILLYIGSPVRWHENEELSFYKAYRALKLRAGDFFIALKSRYRLIEFIRGFLADLNDFAMKDKCRKKRRSSCQQLIDATKQEIYV